MAEIAGFGLSHYPGPLVPPELWPRMLTRNVKIGRTDAELFADKQRWPQPMRDEWGDDEGVSAARRHQRALLDGYRQMRAELDAFAPDFVLIWGDDQFENYRKDCIPAFALGIFDEVVCTPYGRGKTSFQTDTNSWGLPADQELRVQGHFEAGAALYRGLLDAGFDPAYSLSTRHEDGLAHAFANTIVFLDYERAGFPYPVVPFHVNCYGSQLLKTGASVFGEGENRLTPPGPSPARCFALGAATARLLAASPWRVAVIASASWSHGSLTAKNGRLYRDVDADAARLDDLRSGRFTRWGELSEAELDETGQHEFLNWICLAGAMTALDYRLERMDFVETHLFNSAKCFARFGPGPR
ncbi:MAG: hypothetical protein AB7L76_13350 [Burkholderiaceae bacterium]